MCDLLVCFVINVQYVVTGSSSVTRAAVSNRTGCVTVGMTVATFPMNGTAVSDFSLTVLKYFCLCCFKRFEYSGNVLHNMKRCCFVI